MNFHKITNNYSYTLMISSQRPIKQFNFLEIEFISNASRLYLGKTETTTWEKQVKYLVSSPFHRF